MQSGERSWAEYFHEAVLYGPMASSALSGIVFVIDLSGPKNVPSKRFRDFPGSVSPRHTFNALNSLVPYKK